MSDESGEAAADATETVPPPWTEPSTAGARRDLLGSPRSRWMGGGGRLAAHGLAGDSCKPAADAALRRSGVQAFTFARRSTITTCAHCRAK